jgi:hypothetical protein
LFSVLFLSLVLDKMQNLNNYNKHLKNISIHVKCCVPCRRAKRSKRPGMVEHICNPSQARDGGGEFTVLGQPGRKLKTLPTAKQSQKDGDMAQGVCVPTKHEALSSIPETAPKRRRK